MKTHYISMINCLPLLTIFFVYMTTEPKIINLELLDVSFSSTVVTNSLLIASFICSFSVFYYLRWDLDQI